VKAKMQQQMMMMLMLMMKMTTVCLSWSSYIVKACPKALPGSSAG
jgi:hypothetical protein